MTHTLDCPVLGLDTNFPDQVFVLNHRPSGKYGCYCFQGVNGLAVFGSEAAACQFAEWIDLTGMAVDEVDFDEAREIAKARPLPIVCMMLLDNPEDPEIHYVR